MIQLAANQPSGQGRLLSLTECAIRQKGHVNMHTRQQQQREEEGEEEEQLCHIMLEDELDELISNCALRWLPIGNCMPLPRKLATGIFECATSR